MHTPSTSHFAIFATLLAVLLIAGCSNMTDRTADAVSCDFRFANIYYEEWEYELSAESQTVLEMFQDSYKGCQINKVEIIGMADAVGDEKNNMKISQQRAEIIADALAANGWDRSKFDIVAIGQRGAETQAAKKTIRRRALISVEASPS